jgi:hypothetical protein
MYNLQIIFMGPGWFLELNFIEIGKMQEKFCASHH